MKKSPLTTVLLGLLAVATLASLVLCWMYIGAARELRTTQAQFNMVNNNRAVINALVAESIEYSKKNPAINPLLEAAGLKQKEAAPQGARPATK